MRKELKSGEILKKANNGTARKKVGFAMGGASCFEREKRVGLKLHMRPPD